jgi:iron complex outermembrane receptor protein
MDVGGRYLIERPNGPPIVVRATIDNVFDANYWEATSNILILNEPRTFKVSTTFTY